MNLMFGVIFRDDPSSTILVEQMKKDEQDQCCLNPGAQIIGLKELIHIYCEFEGSLMRRNDLERIIDQSKWTEEDLAKWQQEGEEAK